jgi:hypothetical protein
MMNDMFSNLLNNNHIPSLTGREYVVHPFYRALPCADSFGLSVHLNAEKQSTKIRVLSVLLNI